MSEEVEQHILERYEVLQKLGKGAYGIVWKAMDKKYKQVVALKKVFDAFRNSTDAQRTYREVIFLQDLNGHDNIIRLRNVIRAENNMDLYLVFEYMEADLHLVIRAGILEEVHRQYVVYQILKGLKYVHSAELIHRDLKPANILINSDVLIKLGDFGLARSVAYTGEEGDYKLSEYVATRWYRAPEILLGSSKYSKAVDMWSVGCILGELIVGKPIFQGKSSLNQIEKVLELIGRPKQEDIDAIDSPHAETILNSLSTVKKKSFQSFFGDATEDALDLIRKLLAFNPNNRLTVEEALQHRYVAQFLSPEEEIVCDHIIEVPLNDFTKLSTKEYREAIYSHISKKKRERRKKLQELQVLTQSGFTPEPREKQQQPLQQPHLVHHQSQPQSQHKLEKSSTVGNSQILVSKSHTHSPTQSRSQASNMFAMTTSAKLRPYKGYERSQSQYSNISATLSSSILPQEDKSPSPMLEKKNFRANSRVRHVYVGKTEGDVGLTLDEKHKSEPKPTSVSPTRGAGGRKNYYVSGSHVTVKSLLRNTGMSASKVMSQTGNSFILKKK